MTDFTQIFTKLQAAADIADKTLSESEVSVLEAISGQEFSGELGTSGTFTASTGAIVSLQLFNSPGDQDDSGILGALTERPLNSVQWVPVLDARSFGQKCWIKYALEGSVKVGARIDGGTVGLGLNSGSNLQLSTYMQHSPEEKLGTSVAADLQDLPQILSPTEVKNLAAGQAVAIELNGQFSFELTLKWSDLLAHTTKPLADLAQGSNALAISLSGGIDATFAMSLDSQFRIVFAGIDETWLQLQVWRHDERAGHASISAGADVRFVDPEAAAKVLGGVASGLLGDLGMDAQQVSKAISDLRVGLVGLHTRMLGLDEGLRKSLEDWLLEIVGPSARVLERLTTVHEAVTTAGFDETQVAQQLGSTVQQATALIAEVQSWPAALESRIDSGLNELWASLGLVELDGKLKWLLSWLDKIEAGIVEIARSKVELGFKYEWLRTGQRGALVQMKIDRATTNLADFHKAALNLDGGKLLSLADRASSQVVDARLLGHDIKETRIAYGFTLGIGKWSFWSKWRSGEQLVSNERRLKGEKPLVQHALTGYSEYADVFYGPDVTLRGDLAVALQDFQTQDALGRWDIGLNLQSQVVYPKLTRGQLDALLDHAVLWACIETGELTELQELLARLMGRKLRANLQLKLSNSAFSNTHFNDLLSSPLGAEYERAVAGAIPWMSFAERSTVQARETFYKKVARELVSTSNERGNFSQAVDFAVLAAKGLRESRAGASIWKFEQRQSRAISNSFSVGSIAHLVQLNGTMRPPHDRVTAGLEKLGRISMNNTVSKGLSLAREALHHLKQDFRSSIQQRAFGRLLVLLHQKAKAPPRSLAASLTLDVLGTHEHVKETIIIQPKG